MQDLGPLGYLVDLKRHKGSDIAPKETNGDGALHTFQGPKEDLERLEEDISKCGAP